MAPLSHSDINEASDTFVVTSYTRPRPNAIQRRLAFSNRQHRKLYRHVPQWLLKYTLLNHWAPWITNWRYVKYEEDLRKSAYLRSFWNDWSGNIAKKTTLRASQSFRYTSLRSQTSIRLLTILPGESDDPITCAVTHHELHLVPNYQAVSYSWPTSSDPVEVCCDCGTLTIQRSIHELLQRIRSPYDARMVWVDALCINQQDNRERSLQVPLMESVYYGAEKVIIWLGESNDRLEGVDKLINSVNRILDDNYHEGDSLPWKFGVEWEDLAHLLRRAWFSRTWVLQEVCLASEAIVYCGAYQWSWERLCRLFDYALSANLLTLVKVQRLLNRGVTGFMHRWHGEGLDNAGMDLLDLLTASRGTFASEPVDKVYALLNIAVDQLSIEITYEQSVNEVYRSTAEQIIRGGRLDLLSYAGDSVWNNVSGLPSWVPDWTCHEKPVFLSQVMRRKNTTLRQHPLDEQLESPPTDSFSITGDHLTITALELARIHITGKPQRPRPHVQSLSQSEVEIFDSGIFPVSRLEDWHSMLWHPSRKVRSKPYNLTGESKTAAFMRTLVADTVLLPKSHTYWENCYQSFSERLRSLVRDGVTHVYTDTSDRNDGLNEYHEAFNTIMHKRTFFMTKNGLMGIGPAFALSSDRIFLVPGASTPLVMRRLRNERYRLMGECYVHGLKVERELLAQREKCRSITIE